MILQPKEKEELQILKRPKSPDLSVIKELANNNDNRLNADEEVEKEIKEKVEY